MTDRRIGIGLLLVVLVLFAETFTFPVRPHVVLNTEFWPRVLLVLLGLLSCFLIWRGNLDGIKIDPMKLRAFAVVGVCISYVLLLESIGFLILTPVFIFAGSLALARECSRKRIIEAGLSAAIGTALTFFIFQHGLLVQLPEGLLQ